MAATRTPRSEPAPRAARVFPPLELVVFVVGSASLGAEIAAARLMAPFFGASTIVWANTIAVVLVALSAGYWFGGRMADRHPHMRGLCLMVLAAAVLLALVPIVADPFLSLSVDAFDSVSVGAFAGSLFGVLALVAVPVLLLGSVAPWAIRLKMRAIEDSGETAGRLYAISTLGSLVGTFLAALLLIPALGTQRTFMTFAVALAVVGALGLRPPWRLVPLGVAALLAVPVGTVKAGEGERVLHEAETEYQYARVVEEADGDRELELNEGQAVHSTYRADTVLTDGYWDRYLVDPFAARPSGAPLRRIAILGNAGGTTARAYERYFPRTRIDAVEIDGELTEIGKRWFGLRERPELRLFTDDARPYLRRTGERYDAIFLDTYRQPYIPYYLSTREFFELVRDRLAPGGVLAINIGHPEGSEELEKVLSATIAEAFPHVLRDTVQDTNTIVVASTAPLSAANLRAAALRLPRELQRLAAEAASRLAPRLRGGEVYTDDRAPVEWLVDRSIIEYASEGDGE